MNRRQGYRHGRGGLVVKVTDFFPACHGSETSTAEKSPCRGRPCPLNRARPKRPPIDLGSKQPLVHESYEGNRHGDSLLGTSSRRDETILARLRSGHTRAQQHAVDLEVYPPCPNCNVTQTLLLPTSWILLVAIRARCS
ncbi:hypothetical protein TNCV_4244081 [Trichonephila clavipes]|nr:hypothetical protein TNCV_4244081 [Trichonephila clavipes]